MKLFVLYLVKVQNKLYGLVIEIHTILILEISIQYNNI